MFRRKANKQNLGSVTIMRETRFYIKGKITRELFVIRSGKALLSLILALNIPLKETTTKTTSFKMTLNGQSGVTWIWWHL